MEERDNGAEGGNRLRSAMRLETASPATAADVPLTPGIQPRPLPTKGQLYKSFGDGYTRAFELAFTPSLFGAMGYGLDRWIGIVPVLTTLFALAAVLTLLGRTWIGYVEQMRALEQAGPWATQPRLAEGERR